MEDSMLAAWETVNGPIAETLKGGAEMKGGARVNAGRPRLLPGFKKKPVAFKLHPVTIEKIQAFAELRKLNFTEALETIVDEHYLHGVRKQ